MRISFTGTQTGLKAGQLSLLKEAFLHHQISELIHGDCIGADEQAHNLAKEIGVKQITIFPSIFKMKRASVEKEFIPNTTSYIWIPVGNGVNVRWNYPEKPLVRNQLIVDDGDILIACPKEFKHTLRSGTWATIRYGWKVRKDKVYIIPPVE